MKKLLIKVVCFLIILVGVLKYTIDPIFNKEKVFFKESMEEFYNTSKDSVDILIFGSSHSVNSYNPEIIDKTLKTKTFNLGSAAQKLNTTKYLLEEVIEDVEPKVVILDLFYFSVNNTLDKKNKDFQFIVYNNTLNSINKIKTIHNYFGFNEIIPTLSPTIRNHNKWSEVFDEEENNVITTRGFIPLKNKIGDKEREKYRDFYIKKYESISKKYDINGISQSDINNIIEINSLLKKRGIQLILVSAPYFNYFYSEKNLKFHSLIKYLSNDLGVHFLDFNEYFNKLNLDFKDFNDEFHVNVSGSNKLSAFLANYLSDKTNLKIHDKKYLTEYLNSIKPRTTKDVDDRIYKEKNYSINDYIMNDGLYIQKKHKFTGTIVSNEMFFYSNNFNRYIALECDFHTKIDDFQKIQFGIHGVFYEKDYSLRPKWMLGTNDDRMTWNSNPEMIDYKNKKYLILQLDKKCELDNFKKIRIFLKDKGEYKGVIGKAFELNDIKFNKQ